MSERDPEHDRRPADDRGAVRLHRFKLHLAGYFLVMLVIVPVNLLAAPGTPWFVWPMVGWGSVLAIHAAWVMGLFDIFGDRD